MPEQFSVNFTWSPPDTPNGIITEYNLTVTALSTTGNGSYSTSSYTYGAAVQSARIGGFLAYQEFNATVAARTVVGYGPAAEIRGRTELESKNEST